MTLPCVLALGRTRLIPVFVAGTTLFGLPGALGTIVVAGVLYWSLNAWLLHTLLGTTPGQILRELRRPLAATALMVAVVASLAAVAPLDALAADAPAVSLVIKGVVGGAVFAGALSAAWRLEGRPAGLERRVAQLWSR